MLILVINCGSSSAKYQLFDAAGEKSLAKGIVERIGHADSSLKHDKDGHSSLHQRVLCHDHHAAIGIIVEILTSGRYGVISSKHEIGGIGHRVVHGGEEFKESTLITDRVVKSIEKTSELAPLHNPPSLSGIRACAKILKGVKQVAVFDTSFHQTMPEEAFMYGIPFDYYKKYGIRKYGFHGTSHRFVSEEAARVLGRPLKNLKMVTAHLGNGCSMAAVDKGRSRDTTMGFTPLEGLIMGTRSGDLDPAVVLYILEKENLSLNFVNDLLNKNSGLLGLSGISNDMRDVLKGASLGRARDKRSRGPVARRCKLAIEIYIYRIKKYIGAYFAAMGGLDAVVFTAGVGENNPWLVNRIRKELKNVAPKKTKFLVIPTNEELLIARDTYGIIRRKNAVT